MSTKHALLVDDSKSARFALRALLQRNGFEVETAESAESALEKIRYSHPDAIFMDHMMPGMDGYAATELLKKDPATAHIPVVMCTSNDQAEFVRKAKDIGALGILPKPATAEKLSEILDALDREIAALSSPVTTMPPHTVEHRPSSQDINTALRAILPGVVHDIVEPLIEQRIQSQVEQLREEIRAQIVAASHEATEHSLQSAASRWRAETLDELRIETDARDAANLQRTSDRLELQIGELSSNLTRKLDDRFKALTSELMEDDTLRASIRTLAIASAEDLAQKVAIEHATTTARDSAEAISVAVSRRIGAEIEPRFAALGHKINVLAAGAALVGIVAALAGYFLAA